MGTSMNLYVSQHTSGMLQGSVRDDVKFTAYGRAIRFVMGINVDVGYKGYVHCARELRPAWAGQTGVMSSAK